MNRNKNYSRFPILVTVFFITLYLVFAVGFCRYSHHQARLRLHEHSQIIASDLWDFNAAGAVAYLKLAANADHYQELTVIYNDKSIFLHINTEYPTSTEKLFLKLHLISPKYLSAPITFKNKIIGEIEAVWLPQTYIVLLLVFCFLLMVALIITLYARILTEKRLLSHRVRERTNELTELNISLQKEIQERSHAEKQREELQKRLEHSKKMESLGLLAGGVAHDLNNVLSGIVSYPDLLLMDMDKNDPMRAGIETIRKSGVRAGEIVQDLLTLARRGVVTKQPLDFNVLIREYCGSPEYEKLLSQHSAPIEVVLQLTEPIPVIMGSAVALTKVIMNLISNGIEAQPRGGRIILETKPLTVEKKFSGLQPITKGDYIVFRVHDEGEGISDRDIQRIFEPFYTRKVMGRSGTGLGLTVVWGTVEDHHGGIAVTSNISEGTTIDIYLPVCREQLPEPLTEIPQQQLMGNGETILIVDDIDFQRKIACAILKRMNYKVHSVASGKSAIRYLSEHTVDLVILDMILDNGMDGLETYKRILDIHPKQKAIIASGFSETDRVREALQLGAGDYIKKPYNIKQLSMAVQLELKK